LFGWDEKVLQFAQTNKPMMTFLYQNAAPSSQGDRDEF